MKEKNVTLYKELDMLLGDGIAGEIDNRNLLSLIYEYMASNNMLTANDEDLLKIARKMNEIFSENTKSDFALALSNLSLKGIQNIVLDIVIGPKRTKFAYFDEDCELYKLLYKLIDLRNGDSLIDYNSNSAMNLLETIDEARKNGIKINDSIKVEENDKDILLNQMILDILNSGNNRIKVINKKSANAIDTSFNKAFYFADLDKIGSNKKLIKSKIFPEIAFTPRSSASFIDIDELLACIKHTNRRVVAFVPASVLYNDVDLEYRNALINNGLLECVIELPVGTIFNTGIKFCALIFSDNNESVKFLDLTKGKIDELRIEGKSITYNYREARSIDKNDLLNAKNLLPSVILLDRKEIKNATKLKEVAKVLPGNQYTKGMFDKKGLLVDEYTGYKILSNSDIDNGYIDYDSLCNVNIQDNKNDKYLIHQGDLVLTGKTSKIKSIVIKEEPEDNVIAIGGMLIIRPNSRINPIYLKAFLDSEEGQKALKSVQKGNVITTINPSSLANIDIPLIDISKQNEIATRYDALLEKYASCQKVIVKLENEIQNFKY